ncbi:MAG: protein kinase [Acidobacteriota bacterium]
MSLTPGTRMGPYEILSLISVGGMGEVYRAHDSRLKREVALKTSREQFGERFKREARVIASLNHPNICTLHDIGPDFLVMELVEGQTLAERIKGGPLPLAEALTIARPIAEALDAAHEKGVVHRDLKPANIKITPDGLVKVLDFGLAKAGRASEGSGEEASTLTIGLTETGVIMGTAPYMSPEQARGEIVDKRADIWAFGVVLYEMVTGKRPFRGKSVSDILAAVLKEEPDWTSVALAIQPLLKRCLEKDLKRRLRDIGDVWLLLETVPSEQVPTQAPVAMFRRVGVGGAVGVVAMVAVAAVAGWWMVWSSSASLEHPLMRLSVDLGPDAVTSLLLTATLSPDGTRLVFPVRGPNGITQLATRRLDQAQPTLIAGTERAEAPFFKPDGQWIAFFAGGKLKKVSVQGGGVFIVCDAPAGRGGAWGEDDYIIATLDDNSGAGLSRVPATGGMPQALTHPGERGEATHRWPQILPGGQSVLFMGNKTASNYDNSSIEVLSLKSGEIKVLQTSGYFARYLPGGYLVYVRQGALLGLPFDAVSLTVHGTPTVLLEDVAGNPDSAGGQYDFAGNGAFVYLSGKLKYPALRWLDKDGKQEPLLPAGLYNQWRLSPDGRSLAYSNNSEVEIFERVSGTTKQLTFTGQTNVNQWPVWTADGKHIAFDAESAGGHALQWTRSDGSGQAQLLWESKNQLIPRSFSPDGKHLAFSERTAETGFDIWTLALDVTDPEHPKPGKPEVFVKSPALETDPVFSPDGRWIAYEAAELGRSEVLVRPFPPGRSGVWKVSDTGAERPAWSHDGKQLFYKGQDNRLMVSDYVVNGDSFAAGKPRRWSDLQVPGPIDLAPDGKGLVAYTPDEAKNSVHVTFLLNFFDEVRRRVQASKQ